MQVQVSWKNPIPGWVKLNTDGSIIGILRRLVKVGCCAVVMGTGSLVLRGILGVFPAIWLSFGPLGWPLSGSTIERRQYQYKIRCKSDWFFFAFQSFHYKSHVRTSFDCL